MNKKTNFKKLLAATSAMFALNLSATAWGVAAIKDGDTVDPTKSYVVFDTAPAASNGAVTLNFATTTGDLNTLANTGGVQTFAKATVANTTTLTSGLTSPYTGDITININSVVDKAGLQMTGAYFNEAKAFKMNATGTGFVAFNLGTGPTVGTSIGMAKLSAATTAVIDASAGKQNIEFIVTADTAGTTDKIKKAWVTYGSAADTNLKISGATNASFETGYDFSKVAQVQVALGGTNRLDLNNAAVGAPSLVFLTGSETSVVGGFLTASVIPSVSYSPTITSGLPKGGVGGVIVASSAGVGGPEVGIDLTINQVGADKFAVGEVKVIGADAKSVTLGAVGTAAVPATAQYLDKVTYVGAKGVVNFNGSKLVSFNTDGTEKQSAIDFGDGSGATAAVFNVTAANAELKATVTGVSAGTPTPPVPASTINVTNGLKLTGVAAFDFTGGMMSVAAGDVNVANDDTAGSVLGTVSPSAANAKISVTVAQNPTTKLSILGETNFKFNADGQQVTLNIVEDNTKVNIAGITAMKQHSVTFSNNAGQNLILGAGSAVRLNPSFAGTGTAANPSVALKDGENTNNNTITVSKGSTLVGLVPTDAGWTAGVAKLTVTGVGAATFLADQTAFSGNATASLASFSHSLSVLDGGSVRLESWDGTNWAPAVFGNVTLAGNVSLLSDKANANSANVLYAKTFASSTANLQIFGNAILGAAPTSASAAVISLASVSGTTFGADVNQNNAANTLTMMGTDLSVSGNLSTSLLSSSNVKVGSFASDRAGQGLGFLGAQSTDGTQNISGNVVAGAAKYDGMSIGVLTNTTTNSATVGKVAYTGDITGGVTAVSIYASDKGTTMNTANITADSLSMVTSADGHIAFSKDVAINADVADTAAAANLDFKGVTFNNAFSSTNAAVTATSVTVNNAAVTMKTLVTPALNVTTSSTINSGITDLSNLTLGDSVATFTQALTVNSGGVISLNLGQKAGEALIGSDAITISGATVNATVPEIDNLEVGQTFALAKGTKVNADNTTKIAVVGENSDYLSLVLASSADGRSLLAKVSAKNTIGQVVSNNPLSLLSADELKDISADLDAIQKEAVKVSEFKSLANSVKLAPAADKDAATVAIPDSTSVPVRQFTEQFSKLVNVRLDSLSSPVASSVGSSSGSAAEVDGMGIWAEGAYGAGEQKKAAKDSSAADVVDFKTSMYGVAVGADYKLTDTTLFGLAVGYGSGDAKYEGVKAGFKDEVQAVSVTLYSAQNFGDVFMNEKLGFSKADANRSFDRFDATGKKQDGKVNLDSDPIQLFGSLAVGYNVKIAEDAYFTPIGKMRFENTPAYQEAESNSKVGNFNVNNSDVKSLIGSFGGRLAFKLQTSEEMAIVPELHAFANYDLMSSDEANMIKVSAASNDSASVNLVSASAEAFSWEAGAGVTVKSASGFDVGAKVDIEHREKYWGVLGSVKVRLQF